MHFLLLLLFSVFADQGSGIDPDGGRALVHSDTGVCIDPNGRCVHSLDNGDGRAIIDPIGRASAQGAGGDKGLGVDPNG